MTDTTIPSSPNPASRPARSTTPGAKANLLALHVLDLGSKKSKDLEDLKRGRGKLVAEIAETIVHIEARPDGASSAESVLPVVMLVERKRKKNKG